MAPLKIIIITALLYGIVWCLWTIYQEGKALPRYWRESKEEADLWRYLRELRRGGK